jgi:Tol biopolymer transport system component
MMNLKRTTIAAALCGSAMLPAGAAASSAPPYLPGTTVVVSRTNGVGAGNDPFPTDGSSFTGPQSVGGTGANAGRYVVFESGADDLGVRDIAQHAWLKDTQTGALQLLDQRNGTPGNEAAFAVAISEDGSHACFSSSATNLLPGVSGTHLYVVTIATGALTVADRGTGAGGAIGTGTTALDCSLDNAGDAVAFVTNSALDAADDTNSTDDVYTRKLSTNTTTLDDRTSSGIAPPDGVGQFNFAPSIDGDGATVVFPTPDALVAADTNSQSDVYTFDGSTTRLVSRASGASGAIGDGGSNQQSISDDGTAVAFTSAASNLGGTTGGVDQVYVRTGIGGGSPVTTLVSQPDGSTGTGGNTESSDPAISGDGGDVAFSSSSTNLGGVNPTEATNGEDFVRDLSANTTTLVSHAGSGNDNGEVSVASLDETGNHVVWSSTGSDLDPAGDGEFDEVFERQRTAPQATALVSRPAAARTEAVSDSFSPSVSADGRYVAFESDARGFDPIAPTAQASIYVRDNLLGTTSLVSRATGAAGAPADSPSEQPAISADGSTVVFVSGASNLATGVPPGLTQVYARNLVTGTTTLVSRADGASGAAGDHGVSIGVPVGIDADGQRIAFVSQSTNLPMQTTARYGVFVRDLTAGTTTRADVNAAGTVADATAVDDQVAISGDGTRVAFESGATNLINGTTETGDHLYLRDLAAHTTNLVDVTSAGAAGPNGLGESTSISADGTKVAFEDQHLTADSPSASVAEVYVRDVATGQTTLVSRDAGGTPVTSATTNAVISPDGSTVAYQLNASPQPIAVEVRNLATGALSQAGVANGTTTPADDAVRAAALDEDGSCVVFESTASNLVPGDGFATGEFDQVYLHVLGRECPLLIPDTVLDSGPNGKTVGAAKSTFRFHATENGATEAGATFTCSLDGRTVPCTAGSYNTGPLRNGVHHFKVAAKDAGGDADPTAAEAKFTVETPPVLFHVTLTHKTFRLGHKPTAVSARAGASRHTPAGTTFSFRVSEKATVSVAIRHKGKHKTLVTLRRKEKKSGGHAIAFSGRWKKHSKLTPGKYDAVLSATNSIHGKSQKATLHFTVK